MKVQNSVVSGAFYPADAEELKSMILGFLREFDNLEKQVPKAIIAPHAGYIYSGLAAAAAFSSLKNANDKIKRVIVMAPSHRYPFSGIAISSADFFRTPLGEIKVDRNSLDKINNLPQIIEIDAAFNIEHALEVELPFLQIQLENFSLIPLLVGSASSSEIAEVLEILWEEEGTLIVVSSDLSHYHDYKTAQRIDQNTINKILALDYQHIFGEEACGYMGVSGLLKFAKSKFWKPKLMLLNNSGDTEGDKQHVVGYGAVVFEEVE